MHGHVILMVRTSLNGLDDDGQELIERMLANISQIILNTCIQALSKSLLGLHRKTYSIDYEGVQHIVLDLVATPKLGSK